MKMTQLKPLMFLIAASDAAYLVNFLLKYGWRKGDAIYDIENGFSMHVILQLS